VCVAGRTLLEHATSRLAMVARDLIVVVPPDFLTKAQELLPSAAVVAGGATRQESVSSGLAVLADDVEAVLVHDAARAFVPPEAVRRVVSALEAGADAVVPVLPVTDTIRQQDEPGRLGATVDRARLLAVQTPQGFRRDVILAAHQHAAPGDACDDASLAEAIGATVVGVPGSELAFKITHPLDLLLAETVAAR